MESVKATFRQPGVLKAALDYYRCLFNPGLHDPALAAIEQRLFVPPVQVPTLYFHGDQDGCIGVELTEGMESLFASLNKVIVRGAGHFVHQEKPDEVNRRIIEFL